MPRPIPDFKFTISNRWLPVPLRTVIVDKSSANIARVFSVVWRLVWLETWLGLNPRAVVRKFFGNPLFVSVPALLFCVKSFQHERFQA